MLAGPLWGHKRDACADASRRNLNDFQRIEITHKCEDAVKAKARERMEEGRNQYTDSPKEKFPEGKQARDELGKILAASRGSRVPLALRICGPWVSKFNAR